MNNRHKIFVVMFVGLSGFLLFKGWVFIKTQYLPAGAQINGQRSVVLDEDFDNDGLSDIEESFHGTDFENPDTDGDGYLDGEEIASGYDPRLSAPSDVKPGRISRESSRINLTERLIGRLSASIDVGELGDNADNLDVLLEDIAYNTALESLPIFHYQPLTESDIVVLYKNDRTNLQKYADKVFLTLNNRVIATHLGQLQTLEYMLENFDENRNDFSDQSKLYIKETKAAINELSAIQVPSNLIPIHLSVVNTLKELEVAYKALLESDTDILKASITSEKIAEIINRFDSLFIGLIDLAEDQNLNVPDLSLIKIYKLYLGIQ